MILNFLGTLIFILPYLYFHLERIDRNINCFAVCYRHSFEDEDKEQDKANNLETEISVNNKTEETEDNAKNGIFDILFLTKLKFVIIFLFVAYFLFNLCIIYKYIKVDIPVTELIPKESYLKKHMVNHQQLFNVGPIIMFSFLKPLNYWNKQTFNTIRGFLDDAKKLNEIDDLFEMNWLQDTYYNAKQKSAFFPECKKDFNRLCFENTFKETITQLNSIAGDMYFDDVVYTKHHNTTKGIEFKASRFYLQYKNFFGSTNELKVMHELKGLAKNKYNFSTDSLIIYSPVYVFFEQLDELFTSLSSIFVLHIESVVLVSFLFMFDLKAILILAMLIFSLVTSITSNLFLFGYSLNIVTLFHFLVIPSFISEIFFGAGYLMLYKPRKCLFELNPSTNKVEKESGDATVSTLIDKSTNAHSNLSSINENNSLKANSLNSFKNINDNTKWKQLTICYYRTIKHSTFFLLFFLVIIFAVLQLCSTYSFVTLYFILFSTILNLVLHLLFFYQALTFLLRN